MLAYKKRSLLWEWEMDRVPEPLYSWLAACCWCARAGYRYQRSYLEQRLLLTLPLLLFLFFGYDRSHTPFFFLKHFFRSIMSGQACSNPKYLFLAVRFSLGRHTTQPRKLLCFSLFPAPSSIKSKR